MQSIADPDPVIFLEPKSRYWSKESGDLSADGAPIGKARVVREGSDVTVVAYGAMVARSLAAAERASAEARRSEVLDLRSLVPLDVETLAASVAEDRAGRSWSTRRPMTAGFGAEIVARIVEDAFDYLEAPVLRVTGWDTPYPPATLEEHYVPSVKRILRAVDRRHGLLMASRDFLLPDLGEGLEDAEIVSMAGRRGRHGRR